MLHLEEGRGWQGRGGVRDEIKEGVEGVESGEEGRTGVTLGNYIKCGQTTVWGPHVALKLFNLATLRNSMNKQ